MRFQLIDAAKEEFPVQRLCKVLGVLRGLLLRAEATAARSSVS